MIRTGYLRWEIDESAPAIVNRLVAEGRLTLRVAETFPPERAADALDLWMRALEEGLPVLRSTRWATT